MAKKKNNTISKAEIEEEKRKLKQLMPPEKRVAEQRALHKAKELEKKRIPSRKEESKEIHGFMAAAEKAKKLLSPAWYLQKSKIKKKKNKKK
jgi:hypothetical protein